MIYGVCTKCSHTRQLYSLRDTSYEYVLTKCEHCGHTRLFRVVRQVEQPDGSVIEVTR